MLLVEYIPKMPSSNEEHEAIYNLIGILSLKEKTERISKEEKMLLDLYCYLYLTYQDPHYKRQSALGYLRYCLNFYNKKPKDL